MSCRHPGQRRAEIGYDPETATVCLSPTWGTTPRPLGFAPDPMLGLEFLEARRRLGDPVALRDQGLAFFWRRMPSW
jgi:hypothetical protein